MFSVNHFIWLAICAAFIGALLFVSLKFKFKLKTAIYIVSGISFVSEFMKIVTHMQDAKEGMVLGAKFLPFHLCSLLIFAFIYLAFCKNPESKPKLLSLIVPIALAGGIAAILIPTSGVNFAKPFAYQCFIYHSGIIWFALYLICSKQVDLSARAWGRNLAILGVGVVFMLWVNSALQVYDVNFWYLVKPPMKNLPLLNLDNGWYAYFATIVALGVLLITIVHLPSMISQLISKKKGKDETADGDSAAKND